MTIRTSIWRMIASLVLTSFASFWFSLSAATALITPTALDGRLGGTLASFTDRLGAEVPNAYHEYGVVYFNVPGTGSFSAMFRPDLSTYDPYTSATEPAITDVATIVIFSSPRDPNRPATSGDPSDWSVDDAMTRARSFLPTDAVLTAGGDEGDVAFARCESAALLAVSSEFARSSCRVGLVVTDAGTVSYVTLALSIDEPQAGREVSANPCSGVVEWAQATAERMALADQELQRLALLEESDPATPETLADIETSLRSLAEAQQASQAPTVTATANRLLADAFALYADSVALVQEGLETGDSDLIDDAVAGIERANGWIGQVNRLIERGASGCGLAMTAAATPVP